MEAVVLCSDRTGVGEPLALTVKVFATPVVALTGPGLAPKVGAAGISSPVGILIAGSPSRFTPNWIQRSSA